MSLTGRREFVTPEKAEKYLRRNTQNRKLDKNRVEQYANDMRQGRWEETHEGIALNCDGSLKDGQHRLWAIVKSGVGQWLWVFKGLTGDAMLVINTGKIRSLADVMTIEGKPVSKQFIAVGKMMMDSTAMNWSSNRLDVRAFVERHRDAIAFAVGHVTTGKAKCAAVLAAIAKAWHTKDRDRLREFADCVRTGIVPRPEDTAAASLYRAVHGSENFLGAKGRSVLYLKACSAILSFLEERPVQKLYAVTSDPFPLPE